MTSPIRWFSLGGVLAALGTLAYLAASPQASAQAQNPLLASPTACQCNESRLSVTGGTAATIHHCQCGNLQCVVLASSQLHCVK